MIAGVAILIAYTGDGFGLLDGADHDLGTYVAIFALIFGDAIVPILPGETTLNTAAVLAAQGTLELAPIVVAGALGAIAGDSAVYWIARRGTGGLKQRLQRLMTGERVGKAIEFLERRGPMVIVVGRFVPGVRLVVNFTLGVREYPYKRFLLWSSIGGSLWATYTVLLAYYVGTALADFPLASIVISGVITTLALVLLFWGDRLLQRRRGELPESKSVPS